MSKFFPDKFPGFKNMGNTFLPNLGKLLLRFLPTYSEIKLMLEHIYPWEIKKGEAHVSLVRGYDGRIILHGHPPGGPIVKTSRLGVHREDFKILPTHAGLGISDIEEKMLAFMKNEIKSALPGFTFFLKVEQNSLAELRGDEWSRKSSTRQRIFFPFRKSGTKLLSLHGICLLLEPISEEYNPIIKMPDDTYGRSNEVFHLDWDEIIPKHTAHHNVIQDIRDWTLQFEAAATLGRGLVKASLLWERYRLAMKKHEEFWPLFEI